ncbi:MAG TPA: BrnT family toxin [Methylobacterium sp.]|jgi:hypothetical protein
MITFDPVKRNRALIERGLDFEDAEIISAGSTFDREDTRRDYGERRVMTVGFLRERMMIVGWTRRGVDRHVFSMRKANVREQKRYAPFFR